MSAKNILILEDDNTRIKIFKDKYFGHNLTCTKSSKECIEHLKDTSWDILFLDHDLGGEIMVEPGEKETGTDVAIFLNQNESCIPPLVVIHSLNPVGSKRMLEMIPNSTYVPFHIIKDM